MYRRYVNTFDRLMRTLMRLETIPFLSRTHRAITISRCTETMCALRRRRTKRRERACGGKKWWCSMYGHKNTKNGATTEQKIWYQFRKIIRICHAVIRIFAKSNDTCIMHETRSNQKDLERYERLCAASTDHTSICRCAHFVRFASEFYIKWLETSGPGYWSGWHLACLVHFFAFNSIPFLLRFNLSDRCVCRYWYSWMQTHAFYSQIPRCAVEKRRSELKLVAALLDTFSLSVSALCSVLLLLLFLSHRSLFCSMRTHNSI